MAAWSYLLCLIVRTSGVSADYYKSDLQQQQKYYLEMSVIEFQLLQLQA